MSEDKTQQHPGANEAFEKRAREVLRAAELELPLEVNERLVAMRRAAVQELETRSGRQLQAPWYWASAGATSAFVLALGLFLYSGNTPIPMLDDFNEGQLAAAQDMELLEELEFLAWLEEEAVNAG